MSGSQWLARLKNERAPELAPTKPTKPLVRDEAAGFVGFAGPDSVAKGKTLSAEGGGFVGFTGAESRAEPNSHEVEPPAGIDRAEFRDQYARAREAEFSGVMKALTSTERVLVGDGSAARVQRFIERGIAADAAERLALRLHVRDQDQDDRRLCLECSYLGAQGHCIAAASGRLPGASARLEPVQTILQRCDAFGLRKGLV